jgi:hypothetical protein
VEGDGNFEIAGLDVQKIVTLYLLAERATADLLDDSHSMIGVNYVVPNVELTVAVTTHRGTAHAARNNVIVSDSVQRGNFDRELSNLFCNLALLES